MVGGTGRGPTRLPLQIDRCGRKASKRVLQRPFLADGSGISTFGKSLPLLLGSLHQYNCRRPAFRALTAPTPPITALLHPAANPPWQPNPGKTLLTYRCGNSVQTTGATSIRLAVILRIFPPAVCRGWADAVLAPISVVISKRPYDWSPQGRCRKNGHDPACLRRKSSFRL